MKEAAFNDPLTGGISNAAFLLRVQEKLEKEPQRPYVMALRSGNGEYSFKTDLQHFKAFYP